MRELLGGKGANVAEMTRVLGPERVPAGFTITTEACVAYMEADRSEPEGLDDQVAEALERLEEQAGKSARRPRRPAAGLGALGRARVDAGDDRHGPQPGAERRVGRGPRATTTRFAWDSYRRFVQMFGNVCRGIPGERYEDAISRAQAPAGVEDDVELDVDACGR